MYASIGLLVAVTLAIADLSFQSLSARNKLGLAFGTKKSKKAIEDLSANAIQALPSKNIRPGDNFSSSQLDTASQAIISTMAETTASMPTRAELQSQIDEGKPRPQPHLDAKRVSDVYPIEELVGGEDTLKKLAVKDWMDKVKAGVDVSIQSKFVATRLVAFAQKEHVKKLKVLRYLLMLIEWFKGLKKPTKLALIVPKPEEMQTLSANYGTELILGLRHRFTQDG